MKKLCAVLVIATGLLTLSLTTHFMQPKAFAAACDPSHFPYSFMPDDGFAQGNAPLSIVTDPAGTTTNGNGTYVLPAGNQSVTLNAAYNNSGGNCGGGATAPGGGAAKVLDWVTIDVNDTVINGNPTGGSVIQCPGTRPGGPSIVYNDQDLQYGSGPSVAPNGQKGSEGASASPIAFNPATGGGIENCQNQGKVVYWEDGAGSGGGSHNLTINTLGVYSTFCVTENVSVEFPGDAGLFFSSGNNGVNGNPNSSASHVAQQSNGLCFHTQAPPQCTGCSCPGADCTSIAPSQTVTCTAADGLDPGAEPYAAPSSDPSGADTRFADYSSIPSTSWSLDQADRPQTRTVVTVTDSSGATLVSDVYGNSLDSSGGTRTPTNQLYLGGHWSYQPNGETVNYSFDHEERLLAHNGSYYWVKYSQTAGSHGPCYSATCSLTAIPNVPGAPAGSSDVKAGQQYAIVASVTNTGGVDGNTTLTDTLGGHAFSLTSGSPNAPNYIPGLAPGATDYLTLTPTAGASGSSTISYYPDYWGNTYMNLSGVAGGSACSLTINIYQPFSLTPNANVKLNNSATGLTSEDPDQVINNTWVVESGATVNENVTSVIYELPMSGGSVSNGSKTIAGPYGPGSTTCVYQGAAPNNVPACAPFVDGTYPPSEPLQPGDTYCADMKVPFTSTSDSDPAYVGPGNDILNAVPAHATTCPTPSGGTCEPGDPACPTTGCPTPGGCGSGTISDKPFFKVNNGSVSAGGAFKSATPSCSGGGSLGGWNDDTGINPAPGDFGAGAQIGALALGPTIGVASNQSKLGNSPTALSFANNNSGDKTVDPYSPKLGGNFNPGGANCFTEVTPPVPGGDFTNYPTSKSFPAGFNGPNSIALGDNKTIFVNGDVYIGDNIVYAGNGGGWSLNGIGTTNNVPSFVLHATGNIYIAPGVTELDGLYESTGGKIYTCGSAYAPMPASQLFDNCNKQLSVYGKFVANQVDMMRTFGSVRDDAQVPSAVNAGPTLHTSVAFNRYWCGGNSSLLGVHLYQNSGNGLPNIMDPANHPCNTPEFDPGGLGFILPANGTGCYEPDATPLWEAKDPTGDQTAYFYSAGQEVAGMQVIGCIPTGPAANTEPVYRLYDTVHGTHFYTIFKSEALSVSGTYPGVICEGSCEAVFYVYTSAGQAGVPTTIVTSSHSPYPQACSNGGGLVVNTCAAEVFYSTPELYLSTPNIGKPSNGAPQWDSITSLPPLL
jgi:hypothetical protein